jgi:outer membrane protein assembly factor BamB
MAAHAAWLSRDMDLADETVIANGVVFAYAAGEDATQVMPDRAWNEQGGHVYGGGLRSGPARRVPTSRRAALYALDGQTGKELWSSGTQIESWNHFSGLTVANGRAYVATFDGTLYCFGVARHDDGTQRVFVALTISVVPVSAVFAQLRRGCGGSLPMRSAPHGFALTRSRSTRCQAGFDVQ